MYTEPVYTIAVHKTSLQNSCAQNNFTVQVYTRDVKDCTISRLLSMAMNMLFMMVKHAQKVKEEA